MTDGTKGNVILKIAVLSSLICLSGCSGKGLQGKWEGVLTLGFGGGAMTTIECRSDGSVLESGRSVGNTWRGSTFITGSGPPGVENADDMGWLVILIGPNSKIDVHWVDNDHFDLMIPAQVADAAHGGGRPAFTLSFSRVKDGVTVKPTEH